MQAIIRAAAITLAFSLSFAGAALAQGKQQPPAKQAAPAAKQAPAGKQAPEPAGPQQIALTEQQVQGFITATPEIGKITANLQAEPDQKTMAQLEDLAKKGGFANYDEYETVAFNVGMVI